MFKQCRHIETSTKQKMMTDVSIAGHKNWKLLFWIYSFETDLFFVAIETSYWTIHSTEWLGFNKNFFSNWNIKYRLNGS